MEGSKTEPIVSELYAFIDNYNCTFEKRHGYNLCRCYLCVFPILMQNYKEICKNGKSETELGIIIQAINDDYIESADVRMGPRIHSGLVCGYDCNFYEDCLEAIPFPFWEIDKSELKSLLKLLATIIPNTCTNKMTNERGTNNNG